MTALGRKRPFGNSRLTAEIGLPDWHNSNPGRASVIGLKQWLEGQGLAQYADVLAKNDIDLDALSELAEADLEKLGLTLGHRRKLLRALDARRESLVRPIVASSSVVPDVHDASDAERR